MARLIARIGLANEMRAKFKILIAYLWMKFCEVQNFKIPSRRILKFEMCELQI